MTRNLKMKFKFPNILHINTDNSIGGVQGVAVEYNRTMRYYTSNPKRRVYYRMSPVGERTELIIINHAIIYR
jgi:hypothetical protein